MVDVVEMSTQGVDVIIAEQAVRGLADELCP